MRTVGLLLLLAMAPALALMCAAPASAAAVPHEDAPSFLSTRAHQLFLALDANGDHRVTRDEALSPAGMDTVRAFFPETGGAEEFGSFIEAADSNGDEALDHDELDFALHSGLRQSPQFLELDALQGRAGLFKAIGKFASKVWNGAKKAVTGFFGIDTKKLTGDKSKNQGAGDPNEACVMCQYIVERMETNIKTSGVIPRPGNAGDYYNEAWTKAQPRQDSFQDPLTSFLEVDEQQIPSQMNARRAATHNLRIAERAKFNQIYRVADITLDDVCEQAMPDQYYAHCKSIYAIQSDIVDGLRYQYRPSDICYKVGMCAKGSYITTGIHNQRRFAAIEQAKKQADLYETCNDPMTC